MRISIICAITVFILGAQSAHAEENTELKKFEGKWKLVSGEFGGIPLPKEAFETANIVFEGDNYTYTENPKLGADKGTFTPDPKKPGTMKVKGTEGPNKGKTLLAIYEFKDDTLTICYDLAGKKHPKDFTTQVGTDLFLAVYKREKSEKPEKAR